MTTIAIIDFETTGMRAGFDRIIEVGAVLVEGDAIVGTFSELMHPGCWIPSFITSLTGITNAMVAGKPAPEQVMPALYAFLGERPCLAHNAAFDQRFYAAEMQRAEIAHERPFLCSVLLARRLIHDAPSHRLGALVDHLGLTVPDGMRAHRALADALMTARLYLHLRARVQEHLGGQAPGMDLLQALQRAPKAKARAILDQHRDAIAAL